MHVESDLCTSLTPCSESEQCIPILCSPRYPEWIIPGQQHGSCVRFARKDPAVQSPSERSLYIDGFDLLGGNLTELGEAINRSNPEMNEGNYYFPDFHAGASRGSASKRKEISSEGENLLRAATDADPYADLFVKDPELSKRGLTFRPRAGTGLVWWSRRPDGQIDPASQHTGCPLLKGEKFAMVDSSVISSMVEQIRSDNFQNT